MERSLLSFPVAIVCMWEDILALAMEFTHMPRWLLKPKKVVTWSR